MRRLPATTLANAAALAGATPATERLTFTEFAPAARLLVESAQTASNPIVTDCLHYFAFLHKDDSATGGVAGHAG